eukprot:TRINITY_DN28972_c0_g1_i2.p1 TRINITY_DN28972_c0_g1~~TRINITY_DN28972_c0_g1_i2.p1  ORF type:complete len:432 (+),score=43.59 TRINITY_DN28972_c0_g1_i2:238-1533(+)
MLTWGPSMMNGIVDDTMIDGYQVFVVDAEGFPLSDNVSFVHSRGITAECCARRAYSARVSATLPEGYHSFMVVAFSATYGPLPAGATVKIKDNTKGRPPPEPCPPDPNANTSAPTTSPTMEPTQIPVGFSSVRVEALDCELMQGEAILAFQTGPDFCLETPPTSTTSFTTTTTTTTATTTTSTSRFSHCKCPSAQFNMLYGPVDDTGGDKGACCTVAPGFDCHAYTHNDISNANPCVSEGSIAFRCPCDGVVDDVYPNLISPSVTCKPCAVAASVMDMDLAEGAFAGELVFGPNMRGGLVDENIIEGYQIFIVDVNGQKMGDPVATVPSRNITSSCCEHDRYSVPISLYEMPMGSDRFMVVAWSSIWGALPTGVFVPIVDQVGPRPTIPPPVATSGTVRTCAGSAIAAKLFASLLALLGSTLASGPGRPGR